MIERPAPLSYEERRRERYERSLSHYGEATKRSDRKPVPLTSREAYRHHWYMTRVLRDLVKDAERAAR